LEQPILPRSQPTAHRQRNKPEMMTEASQFM
ncbi:hypothetical protein T01_7896, partial [Trichinella spiralis]